MTASNPSLDGKMSFKMIAACVCMVIAVCATTYVGYTNLHGDSGHVIIKRIIAAAFMATGFIGALELLKRARREKE